MIFISAEDAEERLWDAITPILRADVDPLSEVQLRYLAILSTAPSSFPETTSSGISTANFCNRWLSSITGSRWEPPLGIPEMIVQALSGSTSISQTAGIRTSHCGDPFWIKMLNACWSSDSLTNVTKQSWNERRRPSLKVAEDEFAFQQTHPSRFLGTVYSLSRYRFRRTELLSEDFLIRTSMINKPGKNEPVELWKSIGGRQLDWGVDRALMKLKLSRQIPGLLPSGTGKLKIRPGAAERHWCPLRSYNSYEAAKFGRTSQWTTRKIRSIRHYLLQKKARMI
ncbi:uncharacterized protein M421DRAFT_88369 [Didymella exigua CBS 183.55]|uniref:Uncharacterized protein n=1 Tax=Didymella exigua CBS 183.55 TaxID=1150837 RepID=A0A6A5S108_9PLEO|nr:uncharacterized protein M421DRAFT_88369 [Didymella exigua CBS 183.55]KAF1934405.1 hypothetical protein M421DRAFT_88369 [Didymella exigua CBS 183.55]